MKTTTELFEIFKSERAKSCQHKQLYSTLSNPKIISSLFKKGKKIFKNDLMIRYLPSCSSRNIPQVLFAIPRSVGTAVKRNRYRRVLRMLVFEVLKEFELQGKKISSLNIVIAPLLSFFSQDYLTQKKNMKCILQKLSSRQDPIYKDERNK